MYIYSENFANSAQNSASARSLMVIPSHQYLNPPPRQSSFAQMRPPRRIFSLKRMTYDILNSNSFWWQIQTERKTRHSHNTCWAHERSVQVDESRRCATCAVGNFLVPVQVSTSLTRWDNRPKTRTAKNTCKLQDVPPVQWQLPSTCPQDHWWLKLPSSTCPQVLQNETIDQILGQQKYLQTSRCATCAVGNFLVPVHKTTEGWNF